MRQPDHHQRGAAPQQPRVRRHTGPLRRRDLQGERIAEQECEQQIEPAAEQRFHHRVHEMVEWTVEPESRIVSGAAERPEQRGNSYVHDEDSEKRESPQYVDFGYPQ
ncbi:hypothetical protein [Nocardia pseudovaccinii]|uniref:hypothetical protein n=1 Tax=Nocardia pseudovaccinii TaxID=189540 RepID=UPI001FE078A1|nr:hypothetical protein [Nocardia pseudovaccinii]